MEAASAFAQLQLRFADQLQRRYELIRPLILFAERPTPPHAIRQRAQETGTHPETVRKFTRCFEQQGLVGLVPASGQPPARVSQTVQEGKIESGVKYLQQNFINGRDFNVVVL